MRLFLVEPRATFAKDAGGDRAPDGRKADTPQEAERQGGIGGMSYDSVDDLVGGGGDTGTATSDGTGAGGNRGRGATQTSGPDRVSGGPVRAGDRTSSRSGPPPFDPADLGPPSAARADRTGDYASGSQPEGGTGSRKFRENNLGTGGDDGEGTDRAPRGNIDTVAGTGTGTGHRNRT
jgi:hypothetical protein